MKKLLSLLVVLALVLSMVPTVFAAEPESIFTTQPEDVLAAVNTRLMFSVVVDSDYEVASYRWQYRTASGAKWYNCAKSSYPNGFDTADLTFKTTAKRDGMHYRCKVTLTDGSVHYSNEATITLKQIVTTHPVNDMNIVQGDTVKLSIEATDEAVSYQWKYTNNLKNWSNCTKNVSYSGFDTPELTWTAKKRNYDPIYYRCHVTDAEGNVYYSNYARVHYQPKLINTQPVDVTVAAVNDKATYTVETVSGFENLTYLWQYRAAGSEKWNKGSSSLTPGFDTNSITVTAKAARNGMSYRCVITNNDNGDVYYTEPAYLYIGTPVNVTTNPEAVTVDDGETATFTAAADIADATCQWYVQLAGTTTWTAIEGATNTTLEVVGTAQNNGASYKAAFSYNGLTKETTAAVLTVNPAVTNLNTTSIPGTVKTGKIAAGATASYTTNAGGCNMIIESENVAVKYNGVEYLPEEGVVVVPLEFVNPRLGTQNVVEITNTGAETTVFEVKYEYALGTYENPEIVEGSAYLAADVAEGDVDGYYYSFTAPEDGKLTLSLQKGWDFLSEMVVTCNSVQKVMSQDGTFDPDDEYAPGVLTFDAKAGDEYIIQLIAVEGYVVDEETYDLALDEEGNKIVSTMYPAAYVSADLKFESGSEANPYGIVIPWELPTTIAGVKQAAGAEIFYKPDTPNVDITINANVTVKYNGQTYTAEDGVVSFLYDGAAELFSVTNNGTAAANIAFVVNYPVGSIENPAELVEGENIATVPADSWSGYTYTFTAPSKGVLTIMVSGENGWTYQLNNLTTYQYGDEQNSADGIAYASLNLLDGDVIQLKVNTYGADGTTPAGDVVVTMTFETLGDVEIEQPLPEIPEDGEA